MANEKYRNSRARPVEFPIYANMSQMAGALKIPIGILKKANASGCRFVRNTRAYPEVFFEWFFKQDIDDVEKENWKERSTRAEALTKEVKLEHLKQRLIEFADVDYFVGQLVGTLFFGELDRLAQELPASLKGKDEVKIREEVEKEKSRIKTALTARLEAWRKSVEEHEEQDDN